MWCLVCTVYYVDCGQIMSSLNITLNTLVRQAAKCTVQHKCIMAPPAQHTAPHRRVVSWRWCWVGWVVVGACLTQTHTHQHDLHTSHNTALSTHLTITITTVCASAEHAHWLWNGGKAQVAKSRRWTQSGILMTHTERAGQTLFRGTARMAGSNNNKQDNTEHGTRAREGDKDGQENKR